MKFLKILLKRKSATISITVSDGSIAHQITIVVKLKYMANASILQYRKCLLACTHLHRHTQVIALHCPTGFFSIISSLFVIFVIGIYMIIKPTVLAPSGSLKCIARRITPH